MLNRYLVLDVATAPMPGAVAYMDEPSAPANYKDAEKIAAYIAEKKAEQVERCGLDLDLCQITAVGLMGPDGDPAVMTCQNEDAEREALATVARRCRVNTAPLPVITYNGIKFDLPLVMRRARYLGVSFPAFNLDRFRTPHVDLCNVLTNNGALQAKSLGFYVRRLGWTDLTKALSGAEEARVLETGRWDELASSVRHDLIAAYRLAQWLAITEPTAPLFASQQPAAVSA